MDAGKQHGTVLAAYFIPLNSRYVVILLTIKAAGLPQLLLFNEAPDS